MTKKFTQSKVKKLFKEYIKTKEKIKCLILENHKYKICSTFYDKDSNYETVIIYTGDWIIYKDSYNKVYIAIYPLTQETVYINEALEIENIHLSHFIKWIDTQNYKKYKVFLRTMFDEDFRKVMDDLEIEGQIKTISEDMNQVLKLNFT